MAQRLTGPTTRRGDPDVPVLQGLADPGRLAILRRLSREQPLSAGELAGCCRAMQPTVSHHLAVLRHTGWVRSSSRCGTRRCYTLEPAATARLERIVARVGLANPPQRLEHARAPRSTTSRLRREGSPAEVNVTAPSRPGPG